MLHAVSLAFVAVTSAWGAGTISKRALVQLKEPVNRFPDYVRDLVRWLKSVCPTLGKVRIVQALARAGLSLGVTTVGRMLNDGAPAREPDDEALEGFDKIEAPGRKAAAIRSNLGRGGRLRMGLCG